MAAFFRPIFRLAILIVVAGSVFAAGASLVNRKQAELSRAPKFATRPVPVRVAEAKQGDFPIERQYLATAEADQTADVAARVTAKVVRVACDEGDLVKAGQEIITLDNREIKAQIKTVESRIKGSEEELRGNEAMVAALVKTVAYWQRQLERDLKMQKERAVADTEVEKTQDKLQESQGNLDAAKHKSTALGQAIESLKSEKQRLETTYDYCSIRSPFDGVLTRRMVDPGDLATPNKVLAVIEDRSKVKLAFEVPQEDLSQVRAGLALRFTAGGKSYQAKLSRLYPSLSASRMLRAEVDLSGKSAAAIASGAYIPVSLVLETLRGVTLIPAAAIIDTQSKKTTVYVVQQEHLVLRPVSVLASRANWVAVKGVAPGENVVVNLFLGWTRYSPGQQVEIVP